MALTNPPFIVAAASNALLASTVLQGIGITDVTRMYYGQTAAGALAFVPSATAVPAVLIERTSMRGQRTGFSAGAGTTSYTGTVELTIFVANTDIGSLEVIADNLIDDLIGQGGTGLNIIAVDVRDATVPSPEILAGEDGGQPGMPGFAYCTIPITLHWEG